MPHYIDRANHVILRETAGLVYEGNFSGGFAIVRGPSGHYGFIGRDGQVAVTARYTHCWPFSEGFAKVELEGKAGFIDAASNFTIPLRFESDDLYVQTIGDALSHGLVEFLEDDLWGFVDWRGEVRIPPRFRRILPFHMGRARAQLADVWGFLEADGSFQPDPRAQFYSASGLMIGFSPDPAGGSGNKMGYRNSDGEWAIEPRYDFAYPFWEGLGIARLNGRSFFINRQGDEVADLLPEPTARAEGLFSEGAAVVSVVDESSNLRLHGYVDRGGKWTIAPQYKRAGLFHDGLALVQTY